MPKRRSRTLKGEMTDLAYELKEFENVSVKPTRSVLVTPPDGPEAKKCRVEAGEDVSGWDGRLSTSQCARLPPGYEIGKGAFATAYSHATDPSKIIKFTADKEDAVTSAKLLGKNLAQSVRIFDVMKLKHQKATAPVLKKGGKMQFEDKHNQPIFGIVAEKLAEPSNAQKDAAQAFHRVYTRRQGDKPGSYSTREIARMADPETFYIADYVDPYLVEQECAKGSYGSDPEAVKKACAVNVGEIFDAVDELAHEAGVIPADLHSGNWGVKPDGKLAILDLGISAGKQKPPRIKLLAGVRKKSGMS